MQTMHKLRSNISIVGKGYTGDKTLKYIWGGVPAGAHAAYSFKDNAILLPNFDQEQLTEEQTENLMAWDRHERLHWEKSCGEFMNSKYSNLNQLEQELFQRFEDSRIETGNLNMTATERKRRRIHNDHTVATEAGNDEYLLNFRMREYGEVSNSYEKISTNNRWGYLAMALQFKMAGYGNFPIPEELKKHFDNAWKIVSDGRFTKAKSLKGPGTWICGELAKEVYRVWQTEDEKEEKQDKQNKKGQGDKKGQGEQQSQSKESDNKSQKESINSEFMDSDKESKLDPNRLQAEVGKMSEEQSKDKDFKVKDLNLPYNMEDESVIPDEFPEEFEKICSSISEKANELRAILAVILRSITKNRIEKNRLHGRINKRALARVRSGKTRIMQKTKEGVDLDTDVQIIIDLSGSMWGEKALLAAGVAVCLCEALNVTNQINVEVIGFNSLNPKHPENIQKGMKRAYDRVITYYFKCFDEHYHPIKNRLGSMVVDINRGGSCGGCNVDHEVIWEGASRILKRNKKRKIQFVLSDGRPSGCGGTYGGFLETELSRVNEKIVALGVEQVAIGIQDDSVKKFYPNSIVIEDLSMLDQEALQLIANMFFKKV